MFAYCVILLSLLEAVEPLEMTGSYTTSFQCSDGNYALITGDNLTLEYEYGFSFYKVESFHLYELTKGRHMFDYESIAGQAFIKDNRLKSYEWTDTGIKLTFSDIDNEINLGKYEGEVTTGPDYEQSMIDVREILNPPTDVTIFTPSVEEMTNLREGFGEYMLNASSESYTAISCSSVKITWESSTKENNKSCQADGDRNTTVCPLTLKESDMKAGECVTLAVYAEQYGIHSDKKAYTVCYNANVHKIPLTATLAVVFPLAAVIIVDTVVIMVLCLKNRGQQIKKGQYQRAHQVDDSNTSEKQCGLEMEEHIKNIVTLEAEIKELKRRINDEKKKKSRKRKRLRKCCDSSGYDTEWLSKTKMTELKEDKINRGSKSNILDTDSQEEFRKCCDSSGYDTERLSKTKMTELKEDKINRGSKNNVLDTDSREEFRKCCHSSGYDTERLSKTKMTELKKDKINRGSKNNILDTDSREE